VQCRQIVALVITITLFTALLCGGCSDPPEVAAAKKISKSVAQARNLMKDASKAPNPQAQELLAQAQKLLQNALKTPDASPIAKQGAYELLGGALSEMNARELAGEKLAELQQNFAKADLDLHYTRSQLSLQASNLAYAVGLTSSDDQKLQQYRQELANEKIPQVIINKDKAAKVRMDLEQELAQTKQAAAAARLEAENLFLEAEKFSGDENVTKTSEATAKQLEADILLVRARGEELTLRSAKDDELGRASELAGLQQVLERVDQQINAQAKMVNQTTQANADAQAAVKKSADELQAQLESFHDAGIKLSESYQSLIERQGQAVDNYGQALAGARAHGKKFRSFKSSRPTGTPLDERVEMLVPLNAEVDLAASLARAEIVQAGWQQELVGVLRNVLSSCEQIEQTRKDLATVEIKMAASQLDTSTISKNIQQAQNAALDNLNSAIQTLWSTALPGQKEEGSAEQMVKGLERVKWNWQVWGMLGLAHQARATLQEQMGRNEQAQADTQTAATYLAKANEVRAGLVRAGG